MSATRGPHEKSTPPAFAGGGGKCAFDTGQANMTLVVVRTDLPLPQQMVQACHASALAGSSFDGWKEDTRMALLAARNEEELTAAGGRLHALGIAFCEFFEPDHDIGFSAIASAPIAWKKARKALPGFALWGQEPISSVKEEPPSNGLVAGDAQGKSRREANALHMNEALA